LLEYVRTNIFDSPAQTLVNTVNTAGVMGKGLAAEFKRRYPEMFRRYRQLCDSGALDVGKLDLHAGSPKWVLNFPTKKHWRNPSKLEYLAAGLEQFVAIHAALGITSVSFPQLGTANGGLDWQREVQPMMHQYLAGLAIPVFIHVVGQNPTAAA
jgi:O-acetyl-ADP-ribose deacetylase (regulator of RNase III)